MKNSYIFRPEEVCQNSYVNCEKYTKINPNYCKDTSFFRYNCRKSCNFCGKGKINFLKKHNEYYFTQDAPKVADSEYDKVKKETLKLAKKNPFLEKIINVGNIVGARPSNKFKKILHLKPMLSLSNAFDRDDMVDFLKKIKF